MSSIVVLGFANEESMDAFGKQLDKMQGEDIIQLDDGVKVTVDESGKVKIHHEYSVVRGGAVVGGFLGAIVGTLFLMPVAGAAVGAAGGAAIGELSGKYGIDKDFIQKTSDHLQPGTAALFLMIDHSDSDKVLAEIKGVEATVITTTLSPEAEAALKADLADPGA